MLRGCAVLIKLVLVSEKLATLRAGEIVASRSVGFHRCWSGEGFAAVSASMIMLGGIVLIDGYRAVEGPAIIAVLTAILFMALFDVIIKVFLAVEIGVTCVTLPSLVVPDVAAMLISSERIYESPFAVVAHIRTRIFRHFE